MVEVAVRLTEVELGLVTRLAALKGQTVSDVIREGSSFVPESARRPLQVPERALPTENAS